MMQLEPDVAFGVPPEFGMVADTLTENALAKVVERSAVAAVSHTERARAAVAASPRHPFMAAPSVGTAFRSQSAVPSSAGRTR
ncbi:hypothetical protein [Streptomyces jumonjinensis]|uniref:Uncharacterized protein n=1 Tax=Streptomyces jumonjinensis TaxID=1945 RepID=A0A646KTD6_STRJU|nr:hypothetical protein [Streptomyces jumonjinensis]MQT05360.1 hypothetical protein [Streptomyces jumonjinensis]